MVVPQSLPPPQPTTEEILNNLRIDIDNMENAKEYYASLSGECAKEQFDSFMDILKNGIVSTAILECVSVYGLQWLESAAGVS